MKQTIIALVILLCLTACEYEIPELPKETTSGLNTFGCLVNGELVVHHNKYKNGYSSDKYIPYADYNLETDELKIFGYGQNNKMFMFTVINPQEAKAMPIDTIRYYHSGFYYGGNEIGEIELTCFNAANSIVSGHFRFTGYKYSVMDKNIINRNDSVIVTKGYFDIGRFILNR